MTITERRGRVDDTSPTISIVAPVFNEVETVPLFYERVVTVMDDLGEPFELVLVDDGSTDGSAEAIFRDSLPAIRASASSRSLATSDISRPSPPGSTMQCARRRGHHRLRSPGSTRGHPHIVDRWREGAEVVYAQRAARDGETRFKLATAALFYRMIGLSRRSTSPPTPATSACSIAASSMRWWRCASITASCAACRPGSASGGGRPLRAAGTRCR